MLNDAENCSMVQSGLVGFFDILGYGNFLNNTDVKKEEVTVNKILNILRKNEEITRNCFIDICRSDDVGLIFLSDCKDLLHEIKWLIFSDSIVVTCGDINNEDKRKKYLKLICYFIYSFFLVRNMFLYGMPLRGVITSGNFIVQDTCFAGRPFYEAHELSKKLDLAVCVVENKVFEEFKRLCDHQFVGSIQFDPHKFFLKYKTPMKNEKIKEFYTIWAFRAGDIDIVKDKYFVRETFKKHNKNIQNNAVETKIINTEKYIQDGLLNTNKNIL